MPDISKVITLLGGGEPPIFYGSQSWYDEDLKSGASSQLMFAIPIVLSDTVFAHDVPTKKYLDIYPTYNRAEHNRYFPSEPEDLGAIDSVISLEKLLDEHKKFATFVEISSGGKKFGERPLAPYVRYYYTMHELLGLGKFGFEYEVHNLDFLIPKMVYYLVLSQKLYFLGVHFFPTSYKNSSCRIAELDCASCGLISFCSSNEVVVGVLKFAIFSIENPIYQDVRDEVAVLDNGRYTHSTKHLLSVSTKHLLSVYTGARGSVQGFDLTEEQKDRVYDIIERYGSDVYPEYVKVSRKLTSFRGSYDLQTTPSGVDANSFVEVVKTCAKDIVLATASPDMFYKHPELISCLRLTSK